MNSSFPIVQLENVLIAVSSPYIIALRRLSGNFEFNSERELIWERHSTEAKIC